MRTLTQYAVRTMVAGLAMTLVASTSVDAGDALDGVVIADEGAKFSWDSQVNHAYTVWLSTNLTAGFAELATVQSTPPANTWWEEADHPVRFYAVSRPSATNAPVTPGTETNHVVNGDFAGGLSDWTAVVTTNAVAALSVSNEALSVSISDGGTEHWHLFLRQFDLTLESGTNYIIRFDAQAVAARTLRVMLQGSTGSPTYLSEDVSISSSSATYSIPFTMTDPTDSAARLHFGFGGDNSSLQLDNVALLSGFSLVTNGLRNAAYALNTRMAGGNNFMAAKSMNAHGAPEDYALLNAHHFSHCRIGYKMDEVAVSAPAYTIPASHLAELQNMVDWCLAEGLIAIVDPVHNWANGPGFTTPGDLPKLGRIWEQVAAHFAAYDLENVVFEILNEPHANAPVAADVITTGLAAIRGAAGNEQRIVIVAGDGFSTRQALIDAFDNDEIPAGDDYLIGTFHFYDPRDFTKQGEPGAVPPPPVSWGTASEFAQVGTDFDAVVSANLGWASRNGTEPLPIYLGEFGVDNEADAWHSDRKAWLSWIRMQAEERNFSWAHWNMYNNTSSGKGMGPWTTTEINNPALRSFDANPVEGLMGRYEFEDGSNGGGVFYDNGDAGFTGTGYAAFPTNTGSTTWARIDDVYVPKDDTYTLRIHYASDVERTLRIVSRNDLDVNVEVIPAQTFPSTGGFNSWQTLEVPIAFEAGELADVKIVAQNDQGVHLDWLKVSR